MSPKGCFIRVGTAAEPMTQEMIEDLFAHRVRNSLQNIKSPRQDLTFRQLKIYYESKSLPLNDSFTKTLELLTTDGSFNYVAYLLADENGNSIKLAKYSGTDRCDLISNNEYGYCSLLKATDSILQKLDIENAVSSKITYPYRIDKPLWNPAAMREIVINAIVHNDYSNEIPPKVEIFSDRVEVTSAGRLPEGMDEEDFFGGVSNPRNKELMRVFRDVEMVEALGSGMPRVLQTYGRDCFVFMHNFIRIVIPFQNADIPEGGMKTGTESGMKNDNNTLKTNTINTKKGGTKNGIIEGMEGGMKTVEENPLLVRLKIIEILEKEPKISITELALRLSKARSSVQKHIAFLNNKNIIRRIGPAKGGYWEVIKR